MAKQATVKTSSGQEVTGEVVRTNGRTSHVQAALSVATLGISTFDHREPTITVVDDDGNYWTGTRE
jgi:hypothetical protein